MTVYCTYDCLIYGFFYYHVLKLHISETGVISAPDD